VRLMAKRASQPPATWLLAVARQDGRWMDAHSRGVESA
jgi:hypothetical protein